MPFILGILGIVFLSLALACFRLSYGECDGSGWIMAEVQIGITTWGISRFCEQIFCAKRIFLLIACVDIALA